MDIKNYLFPKKYEGNPIVEGADDAYDVAIAMSDEELQERYLGLAPVDPKTREVVVPRAAQEELYKRFVSPHALQTCTQCWGRGHTGWNDTLHQLAPCMCLQRVIRTEEGKDNKIILLN